MAAHSIETWMRLHVEEYRDNCGEINCTKLAEDCADAFNLYADDNGTIPEWLFDLAVTTAEKAKG